MSSYKLFHTKQYATFRKIEQKIDILIDECIILCINAFYHTIFDLFKDNKSNFKIHNATSA